MNIIKALEDCSDDVNINVSSNQGRSSHMSIPEFNSQRLDPISANDGSEVRRLPAFEGERPEITAVLDLILVDLPLPLDEMILTRDRRELLYRYGLQAEMALICALDTMDIATFRFSLRTYWLLRADVYFDDTNAELPYFLHHYTAQNQWPHTYALYENLFSIRRARGTHPSTVKVSRDWVNNIVSIHRVNNVRGTNEADIYSLYDRFGMTRAQHYLEIHIDQFYRILLFIISVREAILRNDREDNFDGPIPDGFLAREVQEMLYDDNAYGNFLVNCRRRQTTLGHPRNVYLQNLLTTTRTREEDLVLVFGNYVNNLFNVKFNSASSTTSTTTTTIRSVSTTTPKYRLKLLQIFC